MERPENSRMAAQLFSAALRSRDLNLLTVLFTLLSTQSVTRAAEVLQLTQSAISKSLERLRREFDDPLLVRDGNRMRVTPRAQELLPLVTAALEQVTDVFSAHGPFDPARARRRFRIGANDYFQHALGGNLLRRVRDVAPMMKLEFRPTGMMHHEQILVEGIVDLVIGIGWPNVSLRSKLLYADTFLCIVGADHPPLPARLDREAFCALAHLEISPSGMALQRTLIDGALTNGRQGRRVVAMCSSFMVVPEMLRGSGLATVIPARVLPLFPNKSVRIVELDFTLPPYEVSLWWHNVTHADPLARWMREQLVELTP